MLFVFFPMWLTPYCSGDFFLFDFLSTNTHTARSLGSGAKRLSQNALRLPPLHVQINENAAPLLRIRAVAAAVGNFCTDPPWYRQNASQPQLHGQEFRTDQLILLTLIDLPVITRHCHLRWFFFTCCVLSLSINTLLCSVLVQRHESSHILIWFTHTHDCEWQA